MANIYDKDSTLERQIADSVRLGEALGEELAREGEIPPGEEAMWADMDEDRRTLYVSYTERAAAIEKQRLYDSVDPERELAAFRSRRRRRSLRRWAIPAAAAIAVITAAGYYLSHYAGDTHTVSSLADIHPGSSRARIEMGDGKTIELSGQQGVLIRGDQVVRRLGETGVVYELEDNPAAGDDPLNRLITPRGGEYNMTLADGTRVWLNAETVLEYPARFADDRREVRLTGEAYFDVAHNDACPFIVVAPTMEVEVYGTEFAVCAYPESAGRTVLVSGEVGVRGRDGVERRLQPDQAAEFDPQGRLTSIRDVDTRQYTGWMRGYFIFDNEPLADILDVLARWYDTRFVYEQSGVGSYRFTGNIRRSEDISTILTSIRKMAGVTFEADGDTIRVGI